MEKCNSKLFTVAKALFFVFIFSSILLFFIFAGSNLKTDNIIKYGELLQSKLGIWLPIIIIFFYILSNFAGLPTWYFNIMSGYLFGIMTGLLIAWIGMNAGILIAFLTSRYLFRRDFQKKFSNSKIMNKLEKYLEKYKWMTVIMTRVLFFIPYNAQNFAYGITKVDLRVYLAGTALGILPITIVQTFMGYSFKLI